MGKFLCNVGYILPSSGEQQRNYNILNDRGRHRRKLTINPNSRSWTISLIVYNCFVDTTCNFTAKVTYRVQINTLSWDVMVELFLKDTSWSKDLRRSKR